MQTHQMNREEVVVGWRRDREWLRAALRDRRKWRNRFRQQEYNAKAACTMLDKMEVECDDLRRQLEEALKVVQDTDWLTPKPGADDHCGCCFEWQRHAYDVAQQLAAVLREK